MGKKKSKGKHSFPSLLRRHLGCDPAKLPVVEQRFELHDRPNLQLALDAVCSEAGRTFQLLGIVCRQQWDHADLARLTRPNTSREFEPGPVAYVDVPVGDRALACICQGLLLITDSDARLAVAITEVRHYEHYLSAAVIAPDKAAAENFSRLLARHVREAHAFRGKILSIEEDCRHGVQVQFRPLPVVARDQLILPETVLRRIERHTIAFARHSAALKEAGRHLKRGILLYGPPGTGKTLSAMYLASQMAGRTVLLVTSGEIGAIGLACRLARMLEPAMVVLEDVDLIGSERRGQTITANALLFELLNQMDGLAADADVLFVLTTNRPGELEPALAARPGRIDQAIEIPLPDVDCRRRLLELYSQGMPVQIEQMDDLVARIDGASGAFIKELLRKAALIAAEEDSGRIAVCDRHLREALNELLIGGGTITQSLLGSRAGIGT